MILSWMLYSTVVAFLLAVSAWILERTVRLRGQSVRAIWVAAIAGSILLPVTPDLLPERVPSAVPLQQMVEPPASERISISSIPSDLVIQTTNESLSPFPHPNQLFLYLWILGSTAVAGILWVSYWGLRRRRREWRTEYVDGHHVWVAPDTGPAVVGFLRTRIVLPEWLVTADASTRAMILAHEEEHVRAGDPRLVLASLVSAVLLPWNLALWWQIRRLRLALETDCDLRVLRRGVDPRAYSRLLLEVGERGRGYRLAVLALSEPSSFLERRIRLMLTSKPSRSWLHAAGSVAVAGLLVLVACTEPRPSAPEPPEAAASLQAPQPNQRRGWSETPDLPLAHYTNDDMVRAALQRHLPEVITEDMAGGRVHVWLLADREGTIEATEVSAEKPPPGMMGDAFLTPFPQETLNSFERVGLTAYPAGLLGPNEITLWWLQRRADVEADPARGIYQFDAVKMLPAQSIMQAAVKEHHPSYNRVGSTVETPVGAKLRGQIPWFIVDSDGQVVTTWRDRPVHTGMGARQRLEKKFPSLDFSSVLLGGVETESGGRMARIVWATLHPASPRP